MIEFIEALAVGWIAGGLVVLVLDWPRRRREDREESRKFAARLAESVDGRELLARIAEEELARRGPR